MADVKINIQAETQQFQAAMRQCSAEMKQLSSEYSLAAAQAKLSGSAQDGLRAKVTELTGKVGLQKDIVEKARGAATSVAARTMLDSKLYLARYVDGEPEYENRRFQVRCRDIYKVTPEFPCVRRSTLVSAVTACQYSLSLPAIEEFKEA